MVSKVIVFSSAEDDFAKFPRVVRVRMAGALRELAEFPLKRTNVKKLKPLFEGYRKRVGEYRILFDFEGDTVFVHRIKNRKDAYR